MRLNYSGLTFHDLNVVLSLGLLSSRSNGLGIEGRSDFGATKQGVISLEI